MKVFQTNLQSRLNSISKLIASVCISLIVSCVTSKDADPPFTISASLFDQTNKVNLGLSSAEGTETHSIFKPAEETDKFTNGVVITGFKDNLYCQWQSSARDEDSQDTWVAYSHSKDGITWNSPMELAASIVDGYCSSGGWWVAGDTLIAYVNVWPSSLSQRGGFTYCKSSTDGISWSELKPVLMANGDTLNGILEQDPHALPDGRIIGAAHFQPGLRVSPIYTDDKSGIRGWTRAKFPNSKVSNGYSREMEPSWFLRDDNTLVMIFRDQNNSFKCLASISSDRGENWSRAVLTSMPDSRSKQSAGNLPDGIAFMVNNPTNNKNRYPLVITLSKDGKLFDVAYSLREGDSDLQQLRYEGRFKRTGYHYPKAIIWKEYLVVSYATNKEDAEVTLVPLTSLVY